MMKASLTALAAATILVATTDDAHAAGHANGFGDKGELIISADRLVPLFGYTHSSVTIPGNAPGQIRETSVSASGMSFLFGKDLSSYDGSILNQPFNVHSLPRVAFDVTIIDRLTLGIGFAFAFGFGGTLKNEQVLPPGNATRTVSTDAPTTTAFGLAPRVGYILPLGEHLGVWLRGGFAFYSVSAKTETLDNNGNVVVTNKASDSIFSIDLDPQLAIIPTEHFFFTVGPMLNIPIAGGRTYSTSSPAGTVEVDHDISLLHFGLHASLGGWVDIF